MRWAAAAAVSTVLAAGAPAARALPVDRPLSDLTREVWGPDRGLPHSKVQSIAQTPDGYLWLGTDGGLVRFDGVTFRLFNWDSTRQLNLPSIRAVTVARDGTLWIATGGVVLFRYRGGQLEGMRRDPDLRDHPTIALFEDRERRLWLGGQQGVKRVQGTEAIDESATTGLRRRAVRAMAQTTDGAVWLGSDGVLVRRDPAGTARQLTALDGLPAGTVTALAAGWGGALWVGTEGGLARIAGGQVQRFGDALADARVTALLVDRDGAVWIGTRRGLLRRAGEVLETFHRGDDLMDADIRALFEDREGNVWVGTRAGGLTRLSAGDFRGVTERHGLGADAVTAVHEDGAGVLWIGTAGGGLSRLDGRAVKTLGAADGLCVETVHALWSDGDGALWVGGAGGATGNLCRLRGAQFWTAPARGTVRALFRDGDGVLWIGGEGVSRMTADGEIAAEPLPAGHPPNPSPPVFAVHETRDRTLWVAAETSLYQRRGGAWHRLGSQRGLPAKHVVALREDARGDLWLGSVHGLSRYRGGRFQAFGPEAGLPAGPFFSILEGDDGALWMSHPRGVVRVAIADLDAGTRPIPFVPYGLSDGIESGGATGGSGGPTGARRRDGTLWFATNRGAVYTDPRRQRKNQLPPPVVIERVQIDGSVIEGPEGAVESAAPGRRDLQIGYTAPSLVAPTKVRFRYRLEGFDRDWVDAGTRRTAYYTGVPPGRRRFQVVASNEDGVWNEAGASLTLSLAPHFYETGLFRALLAALLVVAAVAMHRWRLRLAEARHEAVLAERLRIAREIHDTLAQGFTGIRLHLDAAGRRMAVAPDKARENLAEARALAEASMTEVRRAIAELRVAPADVATLPRGLREIARQLGTDVEITVDVAGTPRPLPREVELAALRVAQEGITNAVKHARPRAIRVRVAYEPRAVRLDVQDDGAGFDVGAAVPDGHFGLAGVRERVGAAGGTLSVESHPGSGTRLAVWIPSDASTSKHDEGDSA